MLLWFCTIRHAYGGFFCFSAWIYAIANLNANAGPNELIRNRMTQIGFVYPKSKPDKLSPRL